MNLDTLEQLANAAYVYAEVRPSTLLSLIALCRMQHEALRYYQPSIDMGLICPPNGSIKEALAAYERFDKGE